MSVFSLKSLKPIHPYLVLISLLIGLGLLFRVMFASIFSAVMQSSWSSHATYQPLVSLLFNGGNIILPPITNCLSMSHMCHWIWCDWSGYPAVFHCHCLHKNVHLSSCSLLMCFCRYCCVVTGCCICASCSVLLVYPVLSLWWYRISLWSLLLASLMTLCICVPPSSRCTASADPIGKERAFVSIILLNIHILMWFKCFILSIIITYVFGFAIHLS